jgi:hypothetical protein
MVMLEHDSRSEDAGRLPIDFCQSGSGLQSAGLGGVGKVQRLVEEQAVMRSYGLTFAVFAIGIATASIAQAHSLRLECKKITNQDVVCRAITSDGELARDIDIQLLATGDYRVLATGKTNAAGE